MAETLIELYGAELFPESTHMHPIFVFLHVDDQPRGKPKWKEGLQRQRYSYVDSL